MAGRLNDLLPLLGDFGGRPSAQPGATCFLAARYADDGAVETFIRAAEHGFRARDAKEWEFLRQPQRAVGDSPAGLAEWQAEAEAMIRRADAIVCIAGPDFGQSEGLAWEIR